MPGELLYVPGDGAAIVTPDALAVMLRQSGLRCAVVREPDEPNEVDIVLESDQTRLLLATENDGFVSSIEVDTVFVDEKAKSPRVCEMLEMLGWVRED